MSSRFGRIEGVVLNEAGRPISEVLIGIRQTTSREPIQDIAPLTNVEGRFQLPDLPPGRYTLQAFAEGYVSQTLTMTVERGRAVRVEFLLKRAMPKDEGVNG